MAFSTFCTTKGCGKIQEPYLDPKTDKVHCSLCDNEIVNLTPFVKQQMKMSKQFRQKQPAAFAVKCLKCGREEKPKLVSNDVVCGGCSKSLDGSISPIFKNMLKEKLRVTDKDV